MSRTMSPTMEAKFEGSSTRLCKMLRIVRRDEMVFCFTDHDLDLVYDLVGDGDETYLSGTGILTSDIQSQAGLEPNNYEVSGPLTATVTRTAILGRLFHGARAWLFEVDWSDLPAGEIPWMGGVVAEAKVRGSEFVFDIRDWNELLHQTVGRVMLNTCDAEHTLPVDPRCGRTPETETITVTSAVDGMQFTGTITGARPDGYFNRGDALGVTGVNAGIKIKIEGHTAAGVIKLFGFLPETPGVGDTFTLIRGCGKTRVDCMERDNMEQFKGEPDSPGTDQLLRPALPGQGDDG